MSITESGENLSILICTDYQFIYHWMSFAAWYSISKNLPDAKIAVVCSRYPINLNLYSWVYKTNTKFFCYPDVGRKNALPYLNKLYGVYIALKEGLVTQPLLVIDADMMALRGFSRETLKILNNCSFASNKSSMLPPVGPIWYFNVNKSLEIVSQVINKVKEFSSYANNQHLDLLALSQVLTGKEIEDLGNEAYEENITTFTHYKDHCGNFYRKNYEKGVIYPPFAEGYALRTNDMTVNERKVYALWSQMWLAYDALNK